MVSRVANDLAKRELIAQWETYCDYKQTFLESLNNYAKYCDEMAPRMKLTGYLVKIVGKSPNEANEKEWQKDAGLGAFDCASSKSSSRASSRSSGIHRLTPSKLQFIADQVQGAVPMAVDGYSYVAEVQQADSKGEDEIPSVDVGRSLGQIMAKLDKLGGAIQSLNSRVQDLENF